MFRRLIAGVLFASAPCLAMAGAPAAAAQSGSMTTANWAGYQARIVQPTAAQASWVVPRTTWQGRDGYSNQWVGIGGGTKTQGELIQAGTESDNICVAVTQGRCTRSEAASYFWLETYPSRFQERVMNLRVAAGDSVRVSVSYDTNRRQAQFTLCNVTRGACVTATRTSAAPRGVAEFIVERPTGPQGTPRALANYGSATFSSARIESGKASYSLKSLPNSRITMSNGRTLATAGALTARGDGFSTRFWRAL